MALAAQLGGALTGAQGDHGSCDDTGPRRASRCLRPVRPCGGGRLRAVTLRLVGFRAGLVPAPGSPALVPNANRRES